MSLFFCPFCPDNNGLAVYLFDRYCVGFESFLGWNKFPLPCIDMLADSTDEIFDSHRVRRRQIGGAVAAPVAIEVATEAERRRDKGSFLIDAIQDFSFLLVSHRLLENGLVGSLLLIEFILVKLFDFGIHVLALLC